MNSLTTNLHLMMIPFYRPTATRYKLIIEKGAFPSDQYAVESQVMLHGLDPANALVELAPRAGEHTLRSEDILEQIEKHGDSTALVMLSGVQYYTGQLFEIEKITAAGHRKGCFVGWDLAHAVGNAQLSLHDWGVDFACWCTYKYLNSGPGSIGGCFVHQKNFAREPRLKGWWGHKLDTRFNMRQPYDASEGASGFRLSNPPVLCIAAVLASLEIFEAAGGMHKLVAKQRRLTMYLELLLERLVGSDAVNIITPRDPNQRGCQLSLLFATKIKTTFDRMQSKGFFTDMREPNVMRVAPCPLYTSFEDVRLFVVALRDTLNELAKL
jgi:kynureninase